MSKKGFTLIELVMVIIILGLLAAVAVPQFFDLSNQANTAAEQGVVGGIRSGITTYFAQNRAFPATLDGVAVSTPCDTTTPCFGTVLGQGGISSGGWSKLATTVTYQHVGSNTSTYTYAPGTGAFTCTATCP
ncbi:MAG: hypothetical protein A2Z88_11535 [Omnitrophica WOR_2 bacterium GWA2_47_8]|nr:MAG: hypothetical protein A2Z88_11535 [Omnitrophica WOR_2 bacterium GWA2_47_8]